MLLQICMGGHVYWGYWKQKTRHTEINQTEKQFCNIELNHVTNDAALGLVMRDVLSDFDK